MKKFKILKPLMALPIAATPLCVLSSCGGDDYITIANQIKDDTLTIFEEIICPTHRSTWDCGEASEAIKEYLEDEADLPAPAGYDQWSSIPLVETTGDDELHRIYPTSFWEGGGEKFSKGINYGNMWYDLPATPGHQNDAKIMFQSHYDMPLEFTTETWNQWSQKSTKGGGVLFRWDPENEILASNPASTCLGADNGLGIALMLSLAKHKDDFVHGPIRLLFNVDEGASVEDSSADDQDIVAGADLLRYDQLYGQYPNPETEPTDSYKCIGKRPFSDAPENEDPNYAYSNIVSLDGIVKGRIYQSSAGIHDCSMSDNLDNTKVDPITKEPIFNLDLIPGEHDNKEVPSQTNPIYKVKISGLHGGYSSEDINSGYANALQILMKLIFDDSQDQKDADGGIEKYGFHILYVDVPGSASDIPKEATAFITSQLSSSQYPESSPYDLLVKKAGVFEKMIKHSYPNEQNASITVEMAEKPSDFKNKEDEDIATNIQNNGGILNNDRSVELCEFFSVLLYGPMTYFDDDLKEVKTSQSFGPLKVRLFQAGEGTKVPSCEVAFRIVIRSADPDERWTFSEFAHSFAKVILNWISDVDADIEDAVLPIWEKNTDEHGDGMVNLAAEAYRTLGYKPEITNLHGWAEIASYPRIFELGGLQFKPYITCIGPTITDIHEKTESVWTDTMLSWIRVVLYMCEHVKTRTNYNE